MTRFLQLFLNYGLVAAILVWAATVALMAYHLKESPWRWAFILLSLAGLGTIGVIFWSDSRLSDERSLFSVVGHRL